MTDPTLAPEALQNEVRKRADLAKDSAACSRNLMNLIALMYQDVAADSKVSRDLRAAHFLARGLVNYLETAEATAALELGADGSGTDSPAGILH